MSKRILFNLNTSWNIYNFRLPIIKSLQKEGFEIFALAPKDNYVSNLENIGVKCFHIKINHKGINPIEDFYLLIQYYKFFKKIKPNFILSYTIKPNIYGNIAATFFNIPVINNISGLGTLFLSSNMLSYFGKVLYKFSLKHSYHVFFQNKFDSKLFLNHRIVSREKSSVIPGSGINTKVFSQNKKENKCNKFLFVGRLIGDKGVFEYLKAASNVLEKYQNKEFLIAGELGYNNKTAIKKSQLENYCSKQPQIKYLGKVDDMISLLKEVDVVVLPSYREGLSRSLIEAASMSLPIIATDVPGCKDIVIDNYNGLLCDVKSHKSLEFAIKRMIEFDELKRIQMGLNGRAIVKENFEESIVIKFYLNKIHAFFNH
tara:strand:+ start:1753 stop:2868 length:1116 start_codon:yes stop_codon:yes gene_type:complete